MTGLAQAPSVFPRGIFEASLTLIQDQHWLRGMSREFCELLDSCPSDSHRTMIIDLLARTTYLSADRYFTVIAEMGQHVENVWSLSPSKTLFVSSNNKHHVDSSKEVLNQLKSCAWQGTGWSKQLFHVAFGTAIDAAEDGYTLVIVDDFVGSGDSMRKALKWFKDAAVAKGIQVDLRVLTASGCTEGISNLQASGYSVQCMNLINKGLSDYLEGQQLADAVMRMTDLENALAAKIATKVNFAAYRFGWRQQEAVYVRQGGNTPNNVFPVFWWRAVKSGTRSPVMRRT